MAHQDQDMQKLERVLTQSYRSRSEQPCDALDVTHNVMREIRRLTREPDRYAFSGGLDQFVWRTATITAAVVLTATVLTVGLFGQVTGENMLFGEEFESAALFWD